MRSHSPGLSSPAYKYQRSLPEGSSSPSSSPAISHTPGHAFTFNFPKARRGPSSRPPRAAPARGRLGPRAGTRRAAAPHSPPGMAAPATKGPNGGSSPALPTAPRRLRGRAPLSAASAALGFIFPRSHIVLRSASIPDRLSRPAPAFPPRQSGSAPSATARAGRPLPPRGGRKARLEGGRERGHGARRPWLGRRGGAAAFSIRRSPGWV